MLQTQAQGAATLGLTIGDNATDSRKPKGQTLRNSAGRFSTITAVAIPHAHAQGEAPITAYPAAEEPLFAIITTVLTLPVGRSGGPRCCGGIFLRPIERNRRGVLGQPGCREGIDRQRFERDSITDSVEIGRKERIEDVSEPVSMERGPREPRLQQ